MGLVLDTALSLSTKYNVSVVPIAAGLKTPPRDLRWKQYQTEIMPPDQVRKLFANSERMAVIMGKVSGYMECIDFDEPGKYEEWRSLLDENGHEELTKRLVIEKTPRGGAHIYYRCPDGIEGNQKLALRMATLSELQLKPGERAKATIETRGEGGLVVCPPSEGYVKLQGKLSATPSINSSERELLIRAARSFNEVVEQRSDHVRSESTADTSGKPGEDYNAKASWFDILPLLGWTHVFANRDRDYWTRPGKDDKSISATTGNGANDLLYVFSTSCYPLESERCYSKFSVHALCNFSGNYSDAAKDLYARGFGDRSHQPSTVKAPVETTAPSEVVERQRRWVPMSYSSLLTMPPKQMLIDGLLGERDNFMIFGLPKAGKTFVVLDLLLTCVSKGIFAGLFECTRPMHVAYMTNEGLGSLPKRIAACAQFNGTPYDSIQERLHTFMDVPQLYTEGSLDSMDNFVEEWLHYGMAPLDLLVVDTLNKATLGAEENSNDDAAIVATHLLNARRQLGCATCLVHHAGKDGERVRGASAYDGDLDFQLRVVKDGAGIRSLGMTMAKDLGDFEDIAFKLSSVNETCAVNWLGSTEITSPNSDAITQIIFLMKDAPMKEWWTVNQLVSLLPHIRRDTIRKALAREVNTRGIEALVKARVDEGLGQTVFGRVS